MNGTVTPGTDLHEEIAAQRTTLADLLESLPDPSWDAPTLCAGWRVREVVAHITMPFRYSMPKFLAELARNRGNFNAMADRCARRDAAALTAAELATAVRDNIRHPWQPPGGGLQGALTHDVIHGLDITVPLGLDQPVPGHRLRLVLDIITSPGTLEQFGANTGGIQLRADDLDWSFGSGTPVSGQAQDLLLALTGRKLPTGRLRGSENARFSSP